MNTHHPARPLAGPGELVETLPFHLGFRPENSIVVHNTLGPTYIDGPTMTLPLPDDPDTWQDIAEAFAHTFIDVMGHRGRPLKNITVFLYRDPHPGHTDDHTASLLRPAAEQLATILKNDGAVILETIGIVNDRWWAYECTRTGCCEGEPLPDADTPNSLTAGMKQLGFTPRPRPSEIASEFRPTHTNATRYSDALTDIAADLHEQTLTRIGQTLTREGTGRITGGALKDFRNGNTQLMDEIAARIILGLQDESARDQAMTYGEDEDLPHTRQLWAYLARRCVPPHTDKAPPLLTLLGWVAWRQDDTVLARLAFREATAIDPTYEMAELLHHGVSNGADPHRLLKAYRAVGHKPLTDDEPDTP
ncbi:DUF4192 domain-containing protein [Streptomyces sp. NPDC058257]|uniref:DUF4192 domain-containing protein n=1 Tax=unclassified Streptomyces TaxID=2593676 RepID=UPI003661EA33